jgi:tetratricopeptide (TPR) repeat protein
VINKSLLNLLGFLFVAAVCSAVENPNVGSSFNTGNAPAHSGQQQRFITRGNPYGQAGNDIVTGNVGGGKHFRGVVPYGSSYYSGAYSNRRGSRSVNHFIRRSTDPLVNDRNPGHINTYYDSRRTVSSMRRLDGSSDLSNPHLTGQGRTNPYIIPSPVRTIDTTQYQRPLSTNNMDLDQILSRREQLKAQAKETEEGLSEQTGFFDESLSPEGLQEDTEEATEKNVLDELPTEDEESIFDQESEAAPDGADESTKQNNPKLIDRTSPKSHLVPELDIKALSEKGREVLGEHETFASLANEKFSDFMDAAETFIKEGKYYKAADAYALAVIWKPQDARGYLGQSFSLFSAGEYMSSAYYLSRAFELNPQAAAKKYDLADFINDRDVFESRILELTSWREKSGSGELAFLLAYVSYQDGKTDRALTEIRKAKEVMPDSTAVTLLKKIIDPEGGPE